MKDAHFKQHPEWKWCSRDRKKSKNTARKSEIELPSSSDNQGQDAQCTGLSFLLVCLPLTSLQCHVDIIQTMALRVPRLGQRFIAELLLLHGKWVEDVSTGHIISRPNKVCLKCPSVRLYIHPSAKSFFDFNEIWYVDTGR